MKWVKTEYTGFSGKQKAMTGEGVGFKQGSPVSEKAVGVLGGNAKAVILQGMKLWVSEEDGTILRGPDVLIGTEYEKIKNLPYPVLADVLLSASKGISTMNNESMSPAERQAQKQFENAKIRLAKAITDWNRSRYGQIAPGTTL